MPRKSGVFAFLGSVFVKEIVKTLRRVAIRVVRVELGGDRRAAVREEVPVDALGRPRVAVPDGRGEFEVVQACLDQVAGGRVSAFVRGDGFQSVGARLDPDRLRFVGVGLSISFQPHARSARLLRVDGMNGSVAVRPKTRSLPLRWVAARCAMRSRRSPEVTGTARKPASVLTST